MIISTSSHNVHLTDELCQFVEQRTCDWIENDPGARTTGDVLDTGH